VILRLLLRLGVVSMSDGGTHFFIKFRFIKYDLAKVSSFDGRRRDLEVSGIFSETRRRRY
jgi:hypothetical protein